MIESCTSRLENSIFRMSPRVHSPKAISIKDLMWTMAKMSSCMNIIKTKFNQDLTEATSTKCRSNSMVKATFSRLLHNSKVYIIAKSHFRTIRHSGFLLTRGDPDGFLMMTGSNQMSLSCPSSSSKRYLHHPDDQPFVVADRQAVPRASPSGWQGGLCQLQGTVAAVQDLLMLGQDHRASTWLTSTPTEDGLQRMQNTLGTDLMLTISKISLTEQTAMVLSGRQAASLACGHLVLLH